MKIDFKDIKKECVNNLRGGEGCVYLQKLSTVSPVLENMQAYNLITIPSGASIGVHTHTLDEEIIYVLSGEGTLKIDDVNHQFKEGMVSVCKSGRNHSVINTSKNDLVVLAVINNCKGE